MDQIDINTELDSFCCIDKIFDLTDRSIKGSYSVEPRHKFTAIESLAQLGALHVRYLTNFEKFVFLLKVVKFNLPDFTNGSFNIDCEIIANSSGAYSYKLMADNGSENINSHMIFGVREFDNSKMYTSCKSHYEKVFRCLLKNSRGG